MMLIMKIFRLSTCKFNQIFNKTTLFARKICEAASKCQQTSCEFVITELIDDATLLDEREPH